MRSLDYAGLSARERNQLKRELKRKSSLKPSLSSKRSKTAAPAVVEPLQLLMHTQWITVSRDLTAGTEEAA